MIQKVIAYLIVFLAFVLTVIYISKSFIAVFKKRDECNCCSQSKTCKKNLEKFSKE